MKRVCIVPTFDRSELLAVCLEHIHAADPEIEVHVFPDRGSDEREVCSKFGAVHHLTIQHNYHGNSFVMLESLKWAQKYDRVYVVEDDAFVDRSFFTWCDAALEKHENTFAACAWRYSPDALPPSDGPDLVIPWYLSVACALPKRSLFSIIQHAKPEYYSDMRNYADLAYPRSVRRGGNHYEQDGLILRVAEAQSRSCVWPRRPRAVHAGWWGYHMPGGQRFKGTLEERVELVKLVVRNPSLLHSMIGGGMPPNISKCTVCQKPLLSTNMAASLQCVECFHIKFPLLPRTSSSHYYFPVLQPSGGLR